MQGLEIAGSIKVAHYANYRGVGGSGSARIRDGVGLFVLLVRGVDEK